MDIIKLGGVFRRIVDAKKKVIEEKKRVEREYNMYECANKNMPYKPAVAGYVINELTPDDDTEPGRKQVEETIPHRTRTLHHPGRSYLC